MHIKEIDFRSTPLRVLCTTSTNAISELLSFAKLGVVDGLTAEEYTQYLLGAVLVACQAYAVGTVMDINAIRSAYGRQPLSKIQLYKSGCIPNSQYNFVLLINALANLFKHNEEWSSWPENETTKTLRHFGVNENTEFPLSEGVSVILGDSSDLRGLCDVLEGWRFSQIQHENSQQFN
ncbi:MAG: hypothetical protein VXW65_00610 [Pseudomonadota bacterium]|nr:hypothetical protein [Pseudomonadota bacterium]